jgi:hypothetical protein
MVIIKIALFIVFASLLVGEIATLLRKRAMHRHEKALEEDGVVPSGQTLRHGMVVTPDGKGVISTSSKTPEWYRRLL